LHIKEVIHVPYVVCCTLLAGSIKEGMNYSQKRMMWKNELELF